MSLDEKIEKLGDRFRGLWKSRLVDNPPEIDTGWSVTFIYNGDYGETSYYETPGEALDKAIELVEKYETAASSE